MFRWIRAVSNQIVVIKGDVLVSEFVTTLSYPFHQEQNRFTKSKTASPRAKPLHQEQNRFTKSKTA